MLCFLPLSHLQGKHALEKHGVHGIPYLRTTFHLLPALVAGLGVSGSLSNVLPSDAFDCDRAGPLVD